MVSPYHHNTSNQLYRCEYLVACAHTLTEPATVTDKTYNEPATRTIWMHCKYSHLLGLYLSVRCIKDKTAVHYSIQSKNWSKIRKVRSGFRQVSESLRRCDELTTFRDWSSSAAGLRPGRLVRASFRRDRPIRLVCDPPTHASLRPGLRVVFDRTE